MDFAVIVDRRSECVVVRVEGELDMATAPELEAAVGAVGSTPHIVIDLSGCSFLDSAGMRIIAKAVQEVPRVSVVATDPGTLRALEITSVDTMVSVHTSVEDAL